MTTASRISKTYTISLPPELASKAEFLARRDSRTMSELFREAFRIYYTQQARQTLEEINQYAVTRNPKAYTESDIPQLIREVRVDVASSRKTAEKPGKKLVKKQNR
jgi:predicted DNA-binding protein